MSRHIEVIDAAPTGVVRELWTFWLNDNVELVLNSYSCQQRATRRHKWVVVRGYNRLWPRECRIKDDKLVPLPQHVVYDALVQVRHMLKVKRWSEVTRGK